MKTSITHIGFLTALLTAASTAFAAATTAVPTVAKHDVTLLPGPNLTSPASAPQSGPSITILPIAAVQAAQGTFQFIPTNPAGTLKLSSENPNKVSAPSQKKKQPDPDSLRFDATLKGPGAAQPVPQTIPGSKTERF